MSKANPPSARSTVRRVRDRANYDQAEVRAILDDGVICHVGFLMGGGPFVVPMAYARDGDRLLLHGSRASRLMKHLASGEEVCVTVTHLDGLVLARSAFHHSMNYRSVMLFGCPRSITDENDKRCAMDAIVEHIIPGRGADARAPSEAELKATEVVELALTEASAKIRTGPPIDDANEPDSAAWTGLIPMQMTTLKPVPDPTLRVGVEAPEYVTHYRRSGPPGSERGKSTHLP